MKRFITVGSAAAIAVAMTACGGGDSGGGTPSPAPAPAAAPPAAPAAAPAAPPSGGTAPEGATAEMVEQGQAIFANAGLCYVCHGQNAEGTQLAPDLTDSDWLNTDGTFEGIIQVVLNGVPEPVEAPAPMVPRGGSSITDDEVQAVSAYVWSLSN